MVTFWLFWSLISICIGVVVWRKIHAGVKVYALIAVSCLHLSGIFVFYGLINHIPLW